MSNVPKRWRAIALQSRFVSFSVCWVRVVSIIPSVFLLSAHLMAMQIAGAGPLIASVLDWCGVRHPVLERLTRWSWYAFWLGVVLGFGVAATQVILVQREYTRALEVLAYKLKWGVAELVVFAIGLWIYLWGWRCLRSSRLRRGWHIAIGLLTATNLLYHFPSLMLLFTRVAAERIDVAEPMRAAAYREVAFQGDVLAGTVHFWLASLVAGGVALVVIASDADAASEEASPECQRMGTWAASIALVAAMLELPVGTWLLTALPGDDQSQLLGSDLWATGLLGLAFFAALGLMQELAAIAFGSWSRISVRRCALKFCVVLVAMVGASMRLGS